ncbi:hypothetical protein C8Q73DRAFT_833265 [Cubamyces lactineus]|nr:hypothetical protein C8Q73DRAFT_833265 [Cubamyces lactineus]
MYMVLNLQRHAALAENIRSKNRGIPSIYWCICHRSVRQDTCCAASGCILPKGRHRSCPKLADPREIHRLQLARCLRHPRCYDQATRMNTGDRTQRASGGDLCRALRRAQRIKNMDSPLQRLHRTSVRTISGSSCLYPRSFTSLIPSDSYFVTIATRFTSK